MGGARGHWLAGLSAIYIYRNLVVGDQGVVPCTTHLQVLQSAAEGEREREGERTHVNQPVT